MGIMSVKKIIIFLLVIGVMAVVTGCSRWPDGPNGNGGTENYQLEITVEVLGEINTDDGIYYIVLDADGELETWPGEDIEGWEEDFYYVRLNEWGFYFAQVEEGSSGISLTSSLIGEKSFQVTIDLNDLEVPGNSDFNININVITTDLYKHTYDSLDGGFSINTYLGSKPPRIDLEGDSGEDGPNFDIIRVRAEIKTL